MESSLEATEDGVGKGLKIGFKDDILVVCETHPDWPGITVSVSDSAPASSFELLV